jgi:hypothetical protein
MAVQKSVRDVLAFQAKAAQCPSCFSFNHPEYLPEKRVHTVETGFVLTCVVCGTPYPYQANSSQAA